MKTQKPRLVYLDNNATTRVAPEVFEAMRPWLTESWGNPSSAYRFGRLAAEGLQGAREKIAALINADPREIVFTSCGTESTNAALHNALVTHPGRRHVLTTAVEHSATLKYCKQLHARGYEVTLLPVESDGSLDLHLLEKSIRPDTAIVSTMWANNETGVLFPVAEIAALCRSRHVLFHTDAVQVAGKLTIDVDDLGCDFLSLSAHKLHAPKGTGVLYVKRRTKFVPYIVGGGQEQGRRGGTENVAGCVAFGHAAGLAQEHLKDGQDRIRPLRDRLEEAILRTIPRVSRNGAKNERLPNTSNLAFEGVEAEGLLTMLDDVGICASSGSACSAGSIEPSHVLTAMGLRPARARSSLRLSLGIYNTPADVDYALEHLPAIIAKLRGGEADHTTSRPGRRKAMHT